MTGRNAGETRCSDAAQVPGGTGPRQVTYCCRCFYVLSGVWGPVCPECGQPFSLYDPAMFLGVPRTNAKRQFDRIVPNPLMVLGTINVVIIGPIAADSAVAGIWFIKLVNGLLSLIIGIVLKDRIVRAHGELVDLPFPRRFGLNAKSGKPNAPCLLLT